MRGRALTPNARAPQRSTVVRHTVAAGRSGRARYLRGEVVVDIEIVPGPVPLLPLCAARLDRAIAEAGLRAGAPGAPLTLDGRFAGVTADDLRWLAGCGVGWLADGERVVGSAGCGLGPPRGARRAVAVHAVEDAWEATLAERAAARAIAEAAVRAGVRIVDPDRVWIDDAVVLAPGAVLWPEVVLRGRTRVEARAEVRSGCWLTDTTVHADAVVEPHCVCVGAEIGPGAHVGPMAHLRAGAQLGPEVKVGNFVEVKNTQLGAGAKASHLTYLGDATIGAGANVGAGTITCNYDGFAKHRTEIGAGAFIGSNTALVAPVRIGQDAIVGAGSVVTADVADGALAVARAPLKVLEGRAAAIRARLAAKARESRT